MLSFESTDRVLLDWPNEEALTFHPNQCDMTSLCLLPSGRFPFVRFFLHIFLPRGENQQYPLSTFTPINQFSSLIGRSDVSRGTCLLPWSVWEGGLTFLDEQDGCCFSLIWFFFKHLRLNLNQVLYHGQNLTVVAGVRVLPHLRRC